MADLTDTYVLKQHRSLPLAERPTWRYYPVSVEDFDELKEHFAESTGAPADGSGEGELRRPVERTRQADLWIELLTRNVTEVTHLVDRKSRQAVRLPDLEETARRQYWRGTPTRVLKELFQAVTGEPDQEEERSNSASAQP